jgi:rhodanese-related sulfurtransferase
MKQLATVLIFLCCGLFAQANTCTDYKKFSDVPLTEMQQLVVSKSATVIDVNSDASFKKSHIPGAIHFGSQKDKLATLLPKDKNAMIVAYCGGKSCTAWQRAAKAACEMGYTNIRHFSEGIKGWKQS